ncbi:DUF932 domain-containing protein [Microbacterium caowuchunii]|uniref:DUF932 domain-containing protein n=1 Tax=Microbacterium caowuchunii TaxID=2614638 RepID=A0A5N0TFD7_9MICO|nr:DUF932 domain-containing protein [Microbacterium caowuchunii]KAA9133772.1 DUF932 domain-containing protein [Microbacterium caowuchunii]
MNTTATATATRRPAWDVLGTRLAGVTGSIDAMKEADLAGWNVRKVPLYFEDDSPAWDGARVDVADRWATVRTDPRNDRTEYIGVVGGQYTPIQNEEHAELLDAVVDAGGAEWVAAGASHGGRRTFMTMRLPEEVNIGGQDALNVFLVAFNSHDGSSSFKFAVTPVRVACTNMQNAAMRNAKSSFSIRHSSGASRELAEARRALGLTYKYVEEFEVAAEELYAQDFTNREFDAYAARLFNIADEGKASKKAIEKRDGLLALYRESDTLDGIRGTRWGAYQAVTEYVDHVAPVRGRDVVLARATRSFDGAAQRMKASAFALLR